MKRKGIIVLGLALTCMTILPSCSPVNEEQKPVDEVKIKLRSEKEQKLKVGQKMTIIASLYGSNEILVYEVDNKNVITCDKYGDVEAIGVGEATVTLSVSDHPEVKETIHFTITRNFFKVDNGYVNGNVDLDNQEGLNPVMINDGQAQVLADVPGENWYFKTHLERKGYTEAIGGWGVGSFLVNDIHPIGDVMYWYSLRKEGDDNHAKLFYGGWRYDESVPLSKEELVSETVIDISNGVDFEIYRKNTTQYMKLTWEELGKTKEIKHIFELPYFKGQVTFPGVFGQNQRIEISKYESSNEETTINEKLSNFQKAESVTINGIGDTLFKGLTYDLTSKVLPEYTINKNVTYQLEKDVEGVSLTKEGKLTVSKDAKATEIKVIATSLSKDNVKNERVFKIKEKINTTSTLVDTGSLIGKDIKFDDNAKSITTSEGLSYVPLNVNSEEWLVSFDSEVDGNVANNQKLGILSSDYGYMNYADYGIEFKFAKKSNIYFNELNGKNTNINNAANGLLSSNKNKVELLKKGEKYYLFINNKLNKIFDSLVKEKTTPVLYSSTPTKFTNVSIISEKDEIDMKIATNPFLIGSYVDVEQGVYKLASRNFTGANDINWPPVNDYENGLKYSKSLNENFQISFKMKDVTPFVQGNGTIDAKILIYLKSERVTSSLQFIIKDYPEGRKVKFVSNLNDSTWTEYNLPDQFNLLNEESEIKVVRQDKCVELYINGIRVFENEAFMNNNNYWGKLTHATPGIGTFLCGATISELKLETLK